MNPEFIHRQVQQITYPLLVQICKTDRMKIKACRSFYDNQSDEMKVFLDWVWETSPPTWEKVKTFLGEQTPEPFYRCSPEWFEQWYTRCYVPHDWKYFHFPNEAEAFICSSLREDPKLFLGNREEKRYQRYRNQIDLHEAAKAIHECFYLPFTKTSIYRYDTFTRLVDGHAWGQFWIQNFWWQYLKLGNPHGTIDQT